MEKEQIITEDYNNDGISLEHIWELLKLKKFLILIITVAVTFVGVLYTYNFTTPMFKSSGDVIVQYQDKNNTQSDYTNFSTSGKILSTLADLSKKDIVLDKVAKALQTELKDDNVLKYHLDEFKSSNQVRAFITASYDSDSYFINFTAETPYSELSEQIVTDVMRELIAVTNTTQYEMFNNSVSVTDNATAAYYSSPNKRLYVVISVILGVILSVAIVFVLDLFRNTLRTREEIKQFTNRTLLGFFYNNESLNDVHTAYLEENNPAQESYNKLLANIKFASPDNPYKVLHFTSSVMGEGKSTTGICLARTVVKFEKTAIIMDLDLRRPSVHKNFNLEKENGVVDYVYDNMPLEKIIKHDIESGIDIISVGKKMDAPGVLIESEKLKELIAILKTKYDYVFLDTPPVLAAVDTLTISSIADATIFITRANETRKSEIKESLSQLDNVGANVIGVVATHLRQTSSDNYYYQYYEYKEDEIGR